jgi:uncharacterized membrane protein YkoI
MNPVRKIVIGGALAAATLTGGAVGANLIGTAGAATPSTTASTTASTSASATAPAPAKPDHAPDWSKGGHQANGKTETLVTGADATKVTAAAKAAVPGATAQRVETDAEGAAYEVHMTKADGSIVTVKVDSNFKVTQTIDGMG